MTFQLAATNTLSLELVVAIIIVSIVAGTVDVLRHAPGVQLVALFGPEHGVYGSDYAGQYVESSTDPRTGLPVYSLYGATNKPTPAIQLSRKNTARRPTKAWPRTIMTARKSRLRTRGRQTRRIPRYGSRWRTSNFI